MKSLLLLIVLLTLGTIEVSAQQGWGAFENPRNLHPRGRPGGPIPPACREPQFDSKQVALARCSGSCDNNLFSNQVAANLLGQSSIQMTADANNQITTYEIIYDLGRTRVIESVDIFGSSQGYWGETHEMSPETRAAGGGRHNDNNFEVSVSVDNRRWLPLKNTVECYSLNNGCAFDTSILPARYVRVRATSQCSGCVNSDSINSIEIR